VKIGLTLPSFVGDPAIPLAVASEAERAGVDAVFVYDHLFRTRADGSRRPALEAVSLLGAVAQATRSIAVGALTFRAWLRPPASLAAALVTVDRVAPGRVIATIGSGDSQSRSENESFGLGFGTLAERVAALRASVAAAGETRARVWVGGHVSAVRQVAAEVAHGWNTWGSDLAGFESLAASTRAAAVAPGFECSWGGLVVLADDDARARRKAEELGAPADAVIGGPAAVARVLARYRDAGADWVILAPVDARDPANACLVGEHVRPLLAG
jgi:alkanesulfonate monooxygenase SsuD/methylene tetrahydromethanopterin reductase-like flavin-dependent oxidoreductase (luciferase family)